MHSTPDVIRITVKQGFSGQTGSYSSVVSMEVSWIVVVILFHICFSYIEGVGQCHCATSTECNQYPEGTCNSCQQFWSGPNCQKYNIARGDLNTVTLSQGTSNPQIVVDGATAVSAPQLCTKISDEFGKTASWTIVFNTSHEIHRMRIYHYTGYADSLRKFEVSVNADLCYRRSDTENPPSPIDISCGLPLNGNTLTISIPKSAFEFYILALCEVEIYECGDYWFGEECDKSCSCVDANEVCNKVNGSCKSGTRSTTPASTPSQPATDKTPSSTRPTSEPSPTGTTTSKPVGEPGTSLTPGEIAGVVVGVVLVIALIIAVGVVIYMKMQHSRRPKVQDTFVNPVTMASSTGTKPPLPAPRNPYDKTGRGEDDDHTYAYIDNGEKYEGYYVDIKDSSKSNDYYLEPCPESSVHHADK